MPSPVILDTGWQSPIDPSEPHRFPDWVRATRGFCGVYFIRSAVDGTVDYEPAERGQILYIGESHTFQLYETLTRHLQRWSSATNHAYERERVEIRVLLMVDPEQAIALQDEEILRHTPRDNARVPF